jgi:predicted nucleic acid-binding protein
MPALDTSVLVRYIVQDDRAQLAAAKRLIGRCVAEGSTLFVPVTVVLELEWVLRSSFAFGKDNVLMTLSRLLRVQSQWRSTDDQSLNGCRIAAQRSRALAGRRNTMRSQLPCSSLPLLSNGARLPRCFEANRYDDVGRYRLRYRRTSAPWKCGYACSSATCCVGTKLRCPTWRLISSTNTSRGAWRVT